GVPLTISSPYTTLFRSGIIKGPLTGEALTQKVNEVLEGVDLGHKRKWAESIAASASAALAELSQKGADVSGATKQLAGQLSRAEDRKSTRLNSSHVKIS